MKTYCNSPPNPKWFLSIQGPLSQQKMWGSVGDSYIL